MTVIEGQVEPPDLHVIFDEMQTAWQRDDERAECDGDPGEHWFAYRRRCSWAVLQWDMGPLTPDGGIAPTTPRDEL